ncbi:anhydro-N-acetylmuramic acid kinase [Nocardioides mesophilus]|uniref:Anhydro-N-acetylmuramic acid kinase n=1 Tax=Nocardioides mesophilus TaxID=433659 RepID=A0A7G9RGL2_9ACTN|nr:anhydro-N-acetylmuramic acid kinase [Nocardioides mesophilus]
MLSVASGTSADGLDVTAVEVEPAADDLSVEVLDSASVGWPEGLADRLLAVLPPATTTAAELCALDNEVGRAIGAAAATAADRVEALTGRRPDLVVSPGQTVHHEVRDGVCLGTLQVGQPAWVVEATGLPVVSDLRARDVTAGGHGAPLVGRFDELWLRDLADRHGPVAALNLGGIANVSVLAPGRPLLAWDTGPANCLLDVAAARASGGALRCDLDGAMARRGKVSAPLLERLLAHPHFGATPPVSTGRETFSATWLDSVLTASGPVSSDDLLATLTELTARTVAAALEPFAVTEVVASGGGVRNPALWDALVRHLGPARVRPSDDLGLPAHAKEGVMWAVLGFLTWHGVAGASPATGAPVSRVLGRISPGDHPLRLPEPAAQGPGALRVSTRKVH